MHANAAAPDGTVPVVFDDEDGDGRLDVDRGGRPTEVFGVGRLPWE